MHSAQLATKQTVLGTYVVNHTNHTLEMPEWAIEQMLDMLRVWHTHFHIGQPTWVSEHFGLPTLLMRFDCVVRDGTVQVFELEERPEGLGLTALLHNEVAHTRFMDRLREIVEEWQSECGPIIFLESPRRERPSDDVFIAERLGVSHIIGAPKPNGVLYYVRADRTDDEYFQYAHRSISTIADEGSKQYGVGMRLWGERPATIDDLPWGTGFALKRSQCSRSDGTWIYHHSHRGHGVPKTESRAKRELGDNGLFGTYAFCQNWIEPETLEQLPASRLMRRCFFGFSPVNMAWIPLGGCWLARRKTVRMHGASDALCGPLTVPA